MITVLQREGKCYANMDDRLCGAFFSRFWLEQQLEILMLNCFLRKPLKHVGTLSNFVWKATMMELFFIESFQTSLCKVETPLVQVMVENPFMDSHLRFVGELYLSVFKHKYFYSFPQEKKDVMR